MVQFHCLPQHQSVMLLWEKSNKTIAVKPERSVSVSVNPCDDHCTSYGWVAMRMFGKGSESETNGAHVRPWLFHKDRKRLCLQPHIGYIHFFILFFVTKWYVIYYSWSTLLVEVVKTHGRFFFFFVFNDAIICHLPTKCLNLSMQLMQVCSFWCPQTHLSQLIVHPLTCRPLTYTQPTVLPLHSTGVRPRSVIAAAATWTDWQTWDWRWHAPIISGPSVVFAITKGLAERAETLSGILHSGAASAPTGCTASVGPVWTAMCQASEPRRKSVLVRLEQGKIKHFFLNVSLEYHLFCKMAPMGQRGKAKFKHQQPQNCLILVSGQKTKEAWKSSQLQHHD